MKTIVCMAAGAILAAGPALAQEQGFGPEAARDFVMSLGETAESAVREGDWQGIAGWIGDHVEDGAPIQMNGEFVMTEGPTGSYRLSMSGADLERFARMSGSMPQQGGMYEALSDYSLDVSVEGSWPLPDDLVGVAVRFYETGRIDLSRMQEGGDAPAGADGPGGVFSSMTECGMRLARPGDTVVIEAATCDTKSML